MLSIIWLISALGASAQTPSTGQTAPPSMNQLQPAAETSANVNDSSASGRHAVVSDEMRADILMARKRYWEAIEKYQSIRPETPSLDNKIGIAYHQLLQLGPAKRYYLRALKLDKKYPEAINNVGTVYYGQKSFGRAIKQYKRALKLSPDSASIYSNLGTAYFARHKYNDAFDAYQRAMTLDPDVFEHRNAYGVLLQERNVDDLATFHFYMAKVYAKQGIQDRALLYIRKALEEGFKDRARLVGDPEFSGLQKVPEFQQLLALQPRVL